MRTLPQPARQCWLPLWAALVLPACLGGGPGSIPRYEARRDVEGLLAVARLPRNPPPDWHESTFLPAVYALRRIGPDAVPELLARLGDHVIIDPRPGTDAWDEEMTREDALRVLRDMGDERALEPLLRLLEDYLARVETAEVTSSSFDHLLLGLAAINDGSVVAPLRELCRKYARRTDGTKSFEIDAVCQTADDVAASQRCRAAPECQAEGRCAAAYVATDSPCVAISDAACRRSRACSAQGRCFVQPGGDACASEPRWWAPEVPRLPEELALEAAFRFDDAGRDLCIQRAGSGAAAEAEAAYCAEKAKMQGLLVDAARELFLGYRRRHRTLEAGQSIWLERAGEAAVLFTALSGPAPVQVPDPIRLIEEELERTRSRLGDFDPAGLLEASAAREKGPEVAVACEPGGATVTRAVCDCASRERQCSDGGAGSDGG